MEKKSIAYPLAALLIKIQDEKEDNYRTGLFERYNRRYNEDTMTQNVTTMDHHQWAMTIHNAVF